MTYCLKLCGKILFGLFSIFLLTFFILFTVTRTDECEIYKDILTILWAVSGFLSIVMIVSALAIEFSAENE
jgi:hypothetical protein